MFNFGILILVSDILLIYEEIDFKIGKLSVLDLLLFSIMSVMISIRQLLDLGDDLYSEKSMEQNK